MKESHIQRVFKNTLYRRDSKTYSEKGFVKLEKGEQGGTHWVCFINKGKKCYYFDSFGGSLDQ